ncbi:4-diphosphocytidyl-2-C-methyl-D-erythritol kinase [Rhodothermus marinus SG0.5JP17-172]|uniref:4-(cytidine 5'-diphospho)-2-C-methyl-D-erythritol kinase n=1 Tax=Rhodothermus marinus TaxID=29549 RepID=UPI000223DE7B|nr:4-diphosphocytidyl-2-C-methyl-D-erythritol kinase [Rhodothermus marinus SG0.5JP17-172]
MLSTSLTELAPAKINLGLRVLRRRPDGYHDIETVLLRIPWADRLAWTPADSFIFTCSDPSLPTDERNLCVQAARRLAELLRRPPTGRLHLDKRVPYGAGLGSGSSDAAATLRLLLRAWHQSLTPDVLHGLAAALGSDVPFFLLPAPAALATGRGERLQPLSGYRFPFYLAVVVPPLHIATAEAYRLVQPCDGRRPSLVELVRTNDPERWRQALVNDFEAPLFARYPELAALKQWLLEAGAVYAALSGSGSALFGVFTEPTVAQQVAEEARARGLRSWHGQPENAP